jgi:hypothetical protein
MLYSWTVGGPVALGGGLAFTRRIVHGLFIIRPAHEKSNTRQLSGQGILQWAATGREALDHGKICPPRPVRPYSVFIIPPFFFAC